LGFNPFVSHRYKNSRKNIFLHLLKLFNFQSTYFYAGLLLIVVIKDEHNNSNYLDKITNPVLIAANGISLIKKDKVDPEWQNLFYNQEGFEMAYDMLQQTFGCNINLIQTDNLPNLIPIYWNR